MTCQIWFMLAEETDELSQQINKALVKLGDTSKLTHTVFLPRPDLIFDVTVNEAITGDVTEDALDLLSTKLGAVVQIDWSDDYEAEQLQMNRIAEMIHNETRLKVKDLQHWYRHKGDKDNILLCTDIAVDLLRMGDTIPNNLLPSQLLEWFKEYKYNQQFKERYGIDEIQIVDFTNG